MRGKLSDALESCIFNNVSEAAFLKTAGDRCSVLSCLPVCLFACLPLQSVHCDGSRFASPAGSWCLVKLSSCRQSLHSLSLSPRMSPLSVLPSFVLPPPLLNQDPTPFLFLFYTPPLCVFFSADMAHPFLATSTMHKSGPGPGKEVYMRVRLCVWRSSWYPVLTCFSTQVHCAASSLRNERTRNLPRILLQERRREREERGSREGRVGGGEGGKGKVGEGLGTEP